MGETAKRTIFLTGATGLVGSYLLKTFLENGHKVFALSRAKAAKSALERVVEALDFWDERVYREYGKNLVILEGEITEENLGMQEQGIVSLANEVNEVFHCAALIKLKSPLEELKRVNVNGTQNLMDLVQKKTKIKKINYISTAFICGDYSGEYDEKSFDKAQSFITPYEQSKYEAEAIVRGFRDKFCINIYRPSAILGETQTGKILSFSQIFYQVMQILSYDILSFLPVKDAYVNAIPVDDVAKSIYLLSQASTKSTTFHLFHEPTPLEEITRSFFEYLKLSPPEIIRKDEIGQHAFSASQIEILNKTIFSFNTGGSLQSDITQIFMKDLGFSFAKLDQEYFYAQFKFLKQSNFIKNMALHYC